MTQSSAYKNYLLTVLAAILAFSYVDRDVFGLAQEQIKHDLHLTDTEVGLLTGIGFAVLFSIMGIPIARWADRGNRVTIVALTTCVWSVAVCLCGVANGFALLLLCRMATAIGESGCIPTANSLIPDYFSRAERPRAVGRYMLGSPLGAFIGYFAGGWLNQLLGWRETFLVIGVPGLALAALAILTLREPRQAGRSGFTPAAAARPIEAEQKASLKEVATLLWTHRTLRHLWLCYLAWYFAGWGLQQWLPTFFIRNHGLESGRVGTWFAAVVGVGGFMGSWLGGEWASRYAAHNERVQLKAAAGALLLLTLLYAVTLLAPNHYLAFGAMLFANIAECAAYAPMIATLQTLVPAHMRATVLAVSTLFPTFIGMGLGPSLAGALSDLLHPWAAAQSLRDALLVLCPGYCWAAWHAWRASRAMAVSKTISALETPVDPNARWSTYIRSAEK